MIDEGCHTRHGLGPNLPGFDSDTLNYSITTITQYNHQRKYDFNKYKHEDIAFINIHKIAHFV